MHDDPEVTELMREVPRRDWAVRVLDAWAAENYDGREVTRTPSPEPHSYKSFMVCLDYKVHQGETPDAARRAAALAVFPTLSAEKRAEIGECP